MPDFRRTAKTLNFSHLPVSHFPAIFPIVAFCCVLNCVWGAIILARRQLQCGRFWGLAALVWLGAVMIDFAHH
jgi:hypothetical protein